jgi:hypothetical protein
MGGVTSFFGIIISKKSMHTRRSTERSVDCNNINRQEINIYITGILNLVTLTCASLSYGHKDSSVWSRTGASSGRFGVPRMA